MSVLRAAWRLFALCTLTTPLFGLYLLLGLVGSALGALVGIGVLALLPSVLGDLLPAGVVDPWQPWAVARGMALGLGVALGEWEGAASAAETLTFELDELPRPKSENRSAISPK